MQWQGLANNFANANFALRLKSQLMLILQLALSMFSAASQRLEKRSG